MQRALRVVLVVRGEALEERTFARPQRITIGPGRENTFVVVGSQFGRQFPLFRSSADGSRFVLTLAEGMNGKVSIARESAAVSDFVRERRGMSAGRYREQPLGPADWGIIGVDPTGDIAFFFQFIAK